MPGSPESQPLREFLAGARRRVALTDAANAASAGLIAAIATLVVAWATGTSMVPLALVAAIAVGAMAFALRRRGRSDASIARAVERRADCRNLVITATELMDDTRGVRQDIGALVFRHAARRVAELDVRSLFPMQRAWLVVTIAAALMASTAVVLAGRPAPSWRSSRSVGSTAAPIGAIEITVTPPEYTRKAVTALHDPSEVRAIAGSRIHISVESGSTAVALETLDARLTLTRDQQGRFAGDVVADHDGYLGIEANAISPDSPPVKRLIGLAVDADTPPIVRITKPGRDLFLATTGEPVPIEVTAEDDLGLTSLRVAYTKVSGSGENFEFKEGELTLQLTKDGDRRWTGAAALALAPFDLIPGDMVVYRGVAADARPGAAAVESDSFMVQIVSKERAAVGGFTVDDEFNRYAISQQMIILKTERLAARKSSMAADVFADAAQDIAAEQRRVRAEFIFMMGGEMEDLNALADTLDETAEAARETDLAAGRLQNRGALDVILATRHMSRAALRLAEPDTTEALTAERAALVALQRAFSKDRYLLRTLATQERLDQSRRLGGKLADLAHEPKPAATPADSPRTIALRRALAGVAALSAESALGADQAARATTLAESVLHVDAASPAFRDIATALGRAAAAMTAGRAADARPLLERAAIDLSTALRAESPAAPSTPGLDVGQLRGALADALRRGGLPR